MTKEELREYRDLAAYIRELEDKLLELESQAMRITTVIKQDMVDSSGSKDKLADSVAKIVEVQNLINDKIGTLKQKERKVLDTIKALSTKEQRIFYLRYVKGYKWERVAVETGYCWAQTHRIHGKCLKELSKQAIE